MKPETYFLNINTQKQAYYLGLVAGDGTLSKKQYGTKTFANVSVSSKKGDCQIVRSFATDACFNIREKSYFDKRYDKTYYIVEAYSKREATVNVVSELFGGYKKPDRSTPTLQYQLMPHFFRGLFDADGSLSQYKDGSWEFAISTNAKFLISLFNCVDLPVKIYKDKTTTRMRIRRKADILKILSFLYLDAFIYSERKYELMAKFCLM